MKSKVSVRIENRGQISRGTINFKSTPGEFGKFPIDRPSRRRRQARDEFGDAKAFVTDFERMAERKRPFGFQPAAALDAGIMLSCEFHCRGGVARQEVQKRIKARGVEFQLRRKLPENRPEFAPQL